MKNFSFVLLGLVAWVALVLFAPPKAKDEEPSKVVPAETTSAKARATAAREKQRREKSETEAPEPADKTTTEAAEAHRDEAQAAIDAAVITYSPEGVKQIRPWLLDADPEVRMAARDGMVQLGEPDAIPLLRDAAGKLKEHSEIAAFHEAADLLALPAWSETTEAKDAIAEIIGDSVQ
ncbi:HEAT repeat domain-containing protein [Luteolibacter luteus]|uniref:HEAT repeat domain-containing protein n=1 Tax=Luteolibacter luteus TaxID=2728835 RepID=A0A858RGJ5_9BACT|nr:HEAT repeat domain-containing protein [Luteolibacter luteus]QJE95410.1 HEAT repeat domain-containing protein [Luteolibacter luteus]